MVQADPLVWRTEQVASGAWVRGVSKDWLRRGLALALGLALAVGASEGLLRLLGLQPWRYKSRDVMEPTMHEPDPILGWRNKQGSYIVPPYHPTGEPVQVTFLERGRRRTARLARQTKRAPIVLVGGSFTQGWAINDDETFAWKLQERWPEQEVLNYGTGGFGTYQSLLVLERELSQLASADLVLYGFMHGHEARNVAPGYWLRHLASYSRRGHVDVPYATLDASGRLIRHPAERYPSTPFRESSALLTLLESSYMKSRTRGRFSSRRAVTEALLLQMHRACRNYGARFVVVLLQVDEPTKEHYVDVLADRGVPFIDCALELSDEMTVPNEGHPNGRANDRWAACIRDAVEPGLPGTLGSTSP